MIQSALPFGTTITEARQKYLETLKDGGGICPCCGRFGKQYKRKLNSGMVRELIRLYQIAKERGGSPEMIYSVEVDWSEVWQASGKKGKEFQKLRFWDLIRRVEVEEGRSNRWTIRAKGVRFVLGWIRVPRHCFIFDNTRQGFSDDSTDIREALGDHFDYDDLMRC